MRRVLYSVSLAGAVACALAVLWLIGILGPGPFQASRAGGDAPGPAVDTRQERQTVEQRLAQLGFEQHKSGKLVIPAVPLKDLCAALRCRPDDFTMAPGAADGLPPWGDFAAGGGRHLYRRHFHCQIWLDETKLPNDLGEASVQAAVFLWPNGYPDYPE